MEAEEFYRKRLIELSSSDTMKKINKVVDIKVEAQICQEYHEHKLKLLGIGDASDSLIADIRNKLTPVKNLCAMLKNREVEPYVEKK